MGIDWTLIAAFWREFSCTLGLLPEFLRWNAYGSISDLSTELLTTATYSLYFDSHQTLECKIGRRAQKCHLLDKTQHHGQELEAAEDV